MPASTVFSIVNFMAMPMWLLMIILPKWKMTRILVDYKVVPILLSLVYAFYIISSMSGGTEMDFGSLESVMQLFTVESAVLAGWIHYLAFDLLVGMWILDKNQELGIHPLILAPCLIGAFMFGPIGFLLFMAIKAIMVNQQTNKPEN